MSSREMAFTSRGAVPNRKVGKRLGALCRVETVLALGPLSDAAGRPMPGAARQTNRAPEVRQAQVAPSRRHRRDARCTVRCIPSAPVPPEVRCRSLRRRARRPRPVRRTHRSRAGGSQLLPTFGSKPLDRIAPCRVRRWFDAFSRTAPGGANQGLRLLRRIVNFAIALGRIEANPTRGVGPNRRTPLSRVLSREKIDRLHRVLDRQTGRPAGTKGRRPTTSGSCC